MAMFTKRDKIRSNNALLISLAIHIAVFIFAVGYPVSHYLQQKVPL